jgi:hypothetical protein
VSRPVRVHAVLAAWRSAERELAGVADDRAWEEAAARVHALRLEYQRLVEEARRVDESDPADTRDAAGNWLPEAGELRSPRDGPGRLYRSDAHERLRSARTR